MKKLDKNIGNQIIPDVGSVQNPDETKRYQEATNKFNQIARDFGADTWDNIGNVSYIIRDSSKYNFEIED